MKLKVNKEFTKAHQMDQVKADIKEFKERFTDGDVIRAFIDQIGLDMNVYEIIYINGEAFDAGTYYENETHFGFEAMFKENTFTITTIRFYCDMDLYIFKVEPMFGEKMYSFKRFRAE